jgi:hypothetical protein
MKSFQEFSERIMNTKQQVDQMNHYWKDLDHMASDERKKKSMQSRFGIKNIKIDKGNIVSFESVQEGLFSDNIKISPPKADVDRAKMYLDAWNSDVEWDGDSFEVDEGDWTNDLSSKLSYMSGDPKWEWSKHPSNWKKTA